MTGKRLWSLRVLLILALCAILVVPLGGFSAAAPPDKTTTYLISLDKSYSLKFNEQETFRLINQLLDMGAPVKWALKDFKVGNETYPAGTFFIETPFTTTSGVSSDVIISWLESQGKQKGVWPIKHTSATVQVEAKSLVLPRICLFYDKTTYENCLKHYEMLKRMGFKVTLATASDLLVSRSDPTSILARSNVFAMPGGSTHLYSFPTASRAAGIANIQDFVNSGGGYVGVCAGASETLMQSPYTNLQLVDANYHSEWFQNSDPAAGDWEWRALIGPVNLEITAPENPVMFGYGPDAVRAGYGPKPTMYYWGGPAMFNLGSGATALARYDSPTDQPPTPDKVKDIWGEAAVVAADYGQGKAVIFGPHPEWPGAGPCDRMYAQALYHVASIPKASSLQPAAGDLPETIAQSRVDAITDTVEAARPLLQETIETATMINDLNLGGHFHPLGLWYPETVLEYAKALNSQMEELYSDALLFQQEYTRLSALKAKMSDNPEALSYIYTSQSYIEQFFDYAENLTADPHVIPTEQNGAGPFVPYLAENEATNFPGLLWSFSYINEEMKDFDLPEALAYEPLLAEYDALRTAYLLDPTPENKQAMDAKYLALSGFPGPMYTGMYTLRHTLEVMQFKIDTHLLNLLTRADKAKEMVSISETGLSTLVPSWKPATF